MVPSSFTAKMMRSAAWSTGTLVQKNPPQAYAPGTTNRLAARVASTTHHFNLRMSYLLAAIDEATRPKVPASLFASLLLVAIGAHCRAVVVRLHSLRLRAEILLQEIVIGQVKGAVGHLLRQQHRGPRDVQEDRRDLAHFVRKIQLAHAVVHHTQGVRFQPFDQFARQDQTLGAPDADRARQP